MTFYWLLFAIPAFLSFVRLPACRQAQQLGWFFWGGLLTFAIGLRHEVGGDWYTYLEDMANVASMSLVDAFVELRQEAGYSLVNYLSLQLNLGIYGVNFVCAALFSVGLLRFCRFQPYPWLAVLAAVPYLVIVVAMGYTRQAAALGLLLYGFEYLVQGRIIQYLIYTVLAALFHKTAFVFATFALLRPGAGLVKRLVGVALLIGAAAATALLEQMDLFLLHYVEEGMESGGGEIRIWMNVLPAIVFFATWKRWGAKFEDRWLWSIFAVLAVICVPMVAAASTAVDRMAIYLMPLQLVVWARLPILLGGQIPHRLSMTMVAAYYGFVQFVWLTFGTHAPYWVPYNNIIFVDLW